MGWETRRGKRYYYRKVREGGRVRSIYCGSGEAGERAAAEDRQQARERAQEPSDDAQALSMLRDVQAGQRAAELAQEQATHAMQMIHQQESPPTEQAVPVSGALRAIEEYRRRMREGRG